MSVNSNTLRPAVPLLVIRIIKKKTHFWEIYCTAASYTHFLHVYRTKKTSWLHFAHHHRNNIAVVLRSSTECSPDEIFLWKLSTYHRRDPTYPTQHTFNSSWQLFQYLSELKSILSWGYCFSGYIFPVTKCSSIKPTPHYAFTGFQETHKSPPTRRLVRLYNPNQCLIRKLELRRWMMCVWGPRVQTYQEFKSAGVCIKSHNHVPTSPTEFFISSRSMSPTAKPSTAYIVVMIYPQNNFLLRCSNYQCLSFWS